MGPWKQSEDNIFGLTKIQGFRDVEPQGTSDVLNEQGGATVAANRGKLFRYSVGVSSVECQLMVL